MNGLHAMPVIGRGDQHGVDVLAVEDAAEVGRHERFFTDEFGGGAEMIFVHVAHGRAGLFGVVQMPIAAPADADVPDGEAVVGAGAIGFGEHAAGNHVRKSDPGRGGREKTSAAEFRRRTFCGHACTRKQRPDLVLKHTPAFPNRAIESAWAIAVCHG